MEGSNQDAAPYNDIRKATFTFKDNSKVVVTMINQFGQGWLPQDWTQDERFYQYDRWFENEAMQEANMKYYYDQVTGEFDKVLAEHGYVRDGHYYRVEKANNDTLVFFCHFGLGCVLISHLLSMSPMVLWHNLCAAPSSVTTLTSEERRKGIAGFRMNSYGDISHLYAHDEPPAFAARFCECYDNDERHD